MAGDLANYSAELANTIQTGLLEGEFRWGLMSQITYSGIAVKEPIQANLGQEITFTRSSRRIPVTTPRSASSYNSNLDNGMTSSTAPVEQFKLALYTWSDMERVNLFQEQAGIRSQSLRAAFLIGEQAIHSKDRIARNELFKLYLAGNTRIITGTTPLVTLCRVDDVTGFEEVLDSAGAPVAVSGSNPLTVAHYNAAGALVQLLSVTSVAVDVGNESSVFFGAERRGRSGELTFATATLPVYGDSLIAVTRYQVIRPNGRLNTKLLVGGDQATLSLILDGVTRLRNNGVPAGPDGLYTAFMSPTSERQLLQDPQFQLAFTGQSNAREMREAGIYIFAGVKFVRTTEAPVQPASTATTGAYGSEDPINVEIHRILIVGAEALIEADWKGLDNFVNSAYGSDSHHVTQVDNILMVIRPPIDVLGMQATFAWVLATGFCGGTDKFAGKGLIPTADDNVMVKRCVVLEHAA